MYLCKTKTYNSVKFSSKEIIEILKVFNDNVARETLKNKIYQYSKGDTEWGFDNEHEFLSEYDGEIDNALISLNNDTYAFYLYYDSLKTKVKVALNSKEEVDRIFYILDSLTRMISKSHNDLVINSVKPIYSIKKRLPSCDVNKKLLCLLEEYIIKKSKDITNNSGVISKYNITIEDSIGTEIIKSIQDLKSNYFKNDTKSIILKLYIYDPSFKISLRFDTNRSYSYIEIECEGDSASEKVNLIYMEINNILKEFGNYNYLFHSIGSNFGLFFLFPSIFLITFGIKLIPRYGYNLIYLSVIPIFYLVISNFKPYVSFDTKLNESINKKINWLLVSFIGYILYTVFGVLMRIKIFGF